MSKAFAVIAAGGNSVRFGGNKLLAPLAGKPVILRTLDAFKKASGICEIIIVAKRESFAEIAALCEGVTVITGGNSRGESVLNGINAINAADGIVAVHDAARPLVKPELIDRVIAAAAEYGAAVAAVKIRDTVKEVNDGFIAATYDREKLYAAQTPQAFDLRLYREAAAKGVDVTDDSTLFERIGVKVKIIGGDYGNIKITSPEDLAVAKELVRNEPD